jgi:hypothetical protein
MSVAQTRAARRTFRNSSPQSKRGVSAATSARREAAFRERQKKMARRKNEKG